MKGLSIDDHYPMRSPLVVADFLSNLLNNMTSDSNTASPASFAEIGTRGGVIIGCISRLAPRARCYAIERSERRCKELRARGGLEVVQAQLNASTYSSVTPNADLFYTWLQLGQERQQAQLIDKAMLERRRLSTFCAGFDFHLGQAAYSSLVHHVGWLRRTVGKERVRIHRLHFDEQGAEEGLEPFYTLAESQSKPREPGPSLSRLFAGRPGAWGVFTLVCAQVGCERGDRRCPATTTRRGGKHP